jgi:hypothetical protein
VHPRISSKLVNVKSVELQLAQAVCLIAQTLGCQRVWGETKQDSAPFYRRHLSRPVDDQFAIDKDEIAALATEFAAKRSSEPKTSLPRSSSPTTIRP